MPPKLHSTLSFPIRFYFLIDCVAKKKLFRTVAGDENLLKIYSTCKIDVNFYTKLTFFFQCTKRLQNNYILSSLPSRYIVSNWFRFPINTNISLLLVMVAYAKIHCFFCCLCNSQVYTVSHSMPVFIVFF